MAREFENFCKANGMQHVRVAPYHPPSNGLAERAARIFKGGFTTLFPQMTHPSCVVNSDLRTLYSLRTSPQVGGQPSCVN